MSKPLVDMELNSKALWWFLINPTGRRSDLFYTFLSNCCHFLLEVKGSLKSRHCILTKSFPVKGRKVSKVHNIRGKESYVEEGIFEILEYWCRVVSRPVKTNFIERNVRLFNNYRSSDLRCIVPLLPRCHLNGKLFGDDAARHGGRFSHYVLISKFYHSC